MYRKKIFANIVFRTIACLSLMVLMGCPPKTDENTVEVIALKEGDIITDRTKLNAPVAKVAAILIHNKNSALFVSTGEMLANLPEEWTIQIFHLTTNESFIRESVLSADIESGKIVLSKINREVFSLADFNSASLNPYFWNQMLANTVIMFETDSAVCPSAKVPGALDAYLAYDYVGAPWKDGHFGYNRACFVYEDPKRPGQKFVEFAAGIRPYLSAQGFTNIKEMQPRVGNSGLSLRNRDRNNEILARYVPASYELTHRINDVFYACVAADSDSGFKVPSVTAAARFSVENIFEPNPLAFHKAWDFLSFSQLSQISNSCPALTKVITANSL